MLAIGRAFLGRAAAGRAAIGSFARRAAIGSRRYIGGVVKRARGGYAPLKDMSYIDRGVVRYVGERTYAPDITRAVERHMNQYDAAMREASVQRGFRYEAEQAQRARLSELRNNQPQALQTQNLGNAARKQNLYAERGFLLPDEAQQIRINQDRQLRIARDAQEREVEKLSEWANKPAVTRGENAADSLVFAGANQPVRPFPQEVLDTRMSQLNAAEAEGARGAKRKRNQLRLLADDAMDHRKRSHLSRAAAEQQTLSEVTASSGRSTSSMIRDMAPWLVLPIAQSSFERFSQPVPTRAQIQQQMGIDPYAIDYQIRKSYENPYAFT